MNGKSEQSIGRYLKIRGTRDKVTSRLKSICIDLADDHAVLMVFISVKQASKHTHCLCIIVLIQWSLRERDALGISLLSFVESYLGGY